MAPCIFSQFISINNLLGNSSRFANLILKREISMQWKTEQARGLIFSQRSSCKSSARCFMLKKPPLGCPQSFLLTSGWSLNDKKYYSRVEKPRKLQALEQDDVPPDNLSSHFHSRLQGAYSNPRTILRLYEEYSSRDNCPDYAWLIRCFCQIANCFGFNSFWSTRDKELMVSTPLFKNLVYDLIERKTYLKPSYAPRLLYSMATLEYRSWQLLPSILDLVGENVKLWRFSTLSIMSLSLAYLGVSGLQGEVRFGYETSLSRDYSGLLLILLKELKDRISSTTFEDTNTAFDWSAISFSMVLAGLYTWPAAEDSMLPVLLDRACALLNERNLEHSGWVQYYIYQCIYCANAEKPSNEADIKKAVPVWMQSSIKSRWLDGLLLNGQRQGTENMQEEVDAMLRKLNESPCLVNCSFGTMNDDQHAWFVGHLLPMRNLALEYDGLLPLGPGRPWPSGLIQLKQRLLSLLGIHSAVVHRTLWKSVSDDNRVILLSHLLSQFPKRDNSEKLSDTGFSPQGTAVFLKHKKKKFDAWPPSKIIA